MKLRARGWEGEVGVPLRELAVAKDALRVLSTARVAIEAFPTTLQPIGVGAYGGFAEKRHRWRGAADVDGEESDRAHGGEDDGVLLRPAARAFAKAREGARHFVAALVTQHCRGTLLPSLRR